MGGSTRSPTLAAAPAEALRSRYREVRRATVGLLEGLSAEDCALQSMPDASPVRWHLAHTTWFFETFVLARAREGYVPHHPAYEHLFNSYYNAVGEQFPRHRRGLLSRPTFDQVLAYRAEIDRRMDALLADETAAARPGLLSVVELGLNHEQQHQELVCTDVLHLLSLNPLRPAVRPARTPPAAAPAEARWIPHEGGLVSVGHAGVGFAFDNEGPRHRAFLEPFEIASRPVTNREFLAFMEDGGYGRSELWMSEGWAAVQAQGWSEPLYWEKRDGGWWVFTWDGLVPVDLAAPVAHVSWFEADAYARWASARLPTEEEWETAVEGLLPEGNFLEDGWRRPVPRAGTSTTPIQAFGDVWEWTSSDHAPYPGYAPPAGALGEYNGKFMCGQYVLRGGSCVTPRGHVRPTYRNFFPPSARWQFSGFRLAR